MAKDIINNLEFGKLYKNMVGKILNMKYYYKMKHLIMLVR